MSREISNIDFPNEVVKAIKDSVDANIYLLGKAVSISQMYLILVAAIIVVIGIYVMLSLLSRNASK